MLDRQANAVVVRITDPDAAGRFDVTGAADPDLEAPLADRRVDGLGLHLVRRPVGSLQYDADGGRAVVTLTKKLDG